MFEHLYYLTFEGGELTPDKISSSYVCQKNKDAPSYIRFTNSKAHKTLPSHAKLCQINFPLVVDLNSHEVMILLKNYSDLFSFHDLINFRKLAQKKLKDLFSDIKPHSAIYIDIHGEETEHAQDPQNFIQTIAFEDQLQINFTISGEQLALFIAEAIPQGVSLIKFHFFACQGENVVTRFMKTWHKKHQFEKTCCVYYPGLVGLKYDNNYVLKDFFSESRYLTKTKQPDKKCIHNFSNSASLQVDDYHVFKEKYLNPIFMSPLAERIDQLSLLERLLLNAIAQYMAYNRYFQETYPLAFRHGCFGMANAQKLLDNLKWCSDRMLEIYAYKKANSMLDRMIDKIEIAFIDEIVGFSKNFDYKNLTQVNVNDHSCLTYILKSLHQFYLACHVNGGVVPPFLTGFRSRGYAAMGNFCFGGMPPMAVFGRS